MKCTFTGAAVAAALTLTGLSAHAGCVDPRTSAHQGAFRQMAPLFLSKPMVGRFSEKEAAGERIVGTWHVVYTAGGSPFGEAFIQWHNDGTEWENINFPILGGNICVGSWKPVDTLHVFLHHFCGLYTDGPLSGYVSEDETDAVPTRMGYTGVNHNR